MANLSAVPTSGSLMGIMMADEKVSQGHWICRAMCDAEPLPASERTATEELVPAEVRESDLIR